MLLSRLVPAIIARRTGLLSGLSPAAKPRQASDRPHVRLAGAGVAFRNCTTSRDRNAGAVPTPARGEHKRVTGWFHYNSGKATKHPEVRTMPSCVACGAELEPPVRTPHTVYVKSLYRIAGQDYCRHHIIRAAAAAGVITEVRAGAGPVVALTRGASSDERVRPYQQ